MEWQIISALVGRLRSQQIKGYALGSRNRTADIIARVARKRYALTGAIYLLSQMRYIPDGMRYIRFAHAVKATLSVREIEQNTPKTIKNA